MSIIIILFWDTHNVNGPVLYLFHAVDFHVRVRVHPAVPVAGHCGGALFDGPVTAVAHETDHRYYHGQHGTG